jgi:hypothetical protein
MLRLLVTLMQMSLYSVKEYGISDIQK